MDGNVKEIISAYGIDESISNHGIGNYLQKERHELFFENCVEDCHVYGGSNGDWVDMDEYFDQERLVTELCAKYKHVLRSLIKIR